MILAKPKQWHLTYIVAVSILGLGIVLIGAIQIPSYGQPINLMLLIVLAAAAEIAATIMTVGNEKIAFEVGTAIGLGALPFYGPLAASLIVMSSSLAFWLYKTYSTPASERNWIQLTFNIGMHSIAIIISGTVFLAINQTNSPPLIRYILAWLLAAITYDQINFWLLVLMLRLLHGAQFQPRAFWLENRWAMVVNVSVMVIGGTLLALAISRFNSLGIIIFFFPILLSSLSFRLYVRKIQSHMDELENMVTERTRELSEVMREKDAFLAVLTHDMKTPLTTIGLYADIMIQQPEVILKKPHIPQVIRRSQQTLTDIVNNILDLEKIQVGESLNMNLVSFDLIPALEYSVESVSLQADKKQIRLDLSVDLPTLILTGDQRQLERVFQNLLSNAIKYTPEEGKISIEAFIEADQAVICFQDTGFGIPAEDMPYIFDPFRRVAKHENMAIGTGLGLAIVKGIIEAHGGEVQVTSEEGVGSRFVVTLPLQNEKIPV